jgi:hypothetical protein
MALSLMNWFSALFRPRAVYVDLPSHGRVRKIDRGPDSAPVYVTALGAEFILPDELLRSNKGQELLKKMANLEIIDGKLSSKAALKGGA